MTLRKACRWLLCLSLCTLLAPASGLAQEQAKLPLSKVVLFNSGVGFFEHQGEITGDGSVELKFNIEDINDLLKSMVLQDLGGGRVSTVNYGSKDPITKTLATFAIDLTSNPTLADLLGQIRGEKVQIDSPNEIVGTILGVERRQQKVGDQVVESAVLNLLTDEGLRSVPLESVGRIKLANPALDAELRQALTILAMGHATDKKTVTLNFLGEGARPVRVGYIQEAPIWKTSYRLVLEDEAAPFLQGWAIVENTTEEDWQGVSLTLVSGRPISFIMDLYQPLYVPRPLVEPELFASLRPQMYSQDLANMEMEFAESEQAAAVPPAPGQPQEKLARKAGGRQLQDSLRRRVNLEGREEAKDAKLNLQESVQTVAQAGDVGELFQYAIDMPVTLPRQQSAMLPIVNGDVKGEKVSIYNPAVHAKHPLNGLKLTNSTGLHLMQGPVTVFDGGAYAGDAQIEDLQPGTERLISYALDLDTEVAVEAKGTPDQLVSCKLAKGVLITSTRYARSQHYTVKNSGGKVKQVLIEYPFDATWTLLAPKLPDEKTRDLYRFALSAEPGKPAGLVIEEERIAEQGIGLNNLDDGTIRFYMSTAVVSDKVKQALAEVIAKKTALAEVAARRQQREQQVVLIGQEQDRIRQNMAQLDRTIDLYKRYVKKFGEQEDQVETLREEIQTLTAEETQLRQALDAYLLSLDLS